jgi:hypothetical protein
VEGASFSVELKDTGDAPGTARPGDLGPDEVARAAGRLGIWAEGAMVLWAGANVIEEGIEGTDPTEVDSGDGFAGVGTAERGTVLDA